MITQNLFQPIAQPTITGCDYRNRKVRPVPTTAYSSKTLKYLATRKNVVIKNGFVTVV